MKKRFKFYEPDQTLLLPPSLHEWLPKNHLAYFISDTVDQMDLSAIYDNYKNERGQPPYAPRMMVKIWLYGFSQGIRSSRKIEKALYEDIGFRMLSANQQPDHWTLNEFRRRHLEALGGLFVQTVQMAQRANIVKMGHVAIDGTKIKANASKHSAMSYGRMQEEERRLREEIEQYFREADEIDEEEDRLYGSRRGDELPESLSTPEKRLKTIREAMKALEEEARQKAEDEERKKREKKEEQKKSKQEADEVCQGNEVKEIKPSPKAQRNFTDPESRIMLNSEKAFIQGYNAQAAVDARSQIIVGADLTNQAADSPHLHGMVKQVIKNTGEVPEEVSADAGYWSEKNVEFLKGYSIEVFIPPDKVKHSEWRKVVSPRGRIPKNLSIKDLMRRKLKTKLGRKRYKNRQESVEPVFGQTKESRGLRQFLLRGVKKVRSMWLIDCAVHNLLKIFRAGVCFQPG